MTTLLSDLYRRIGVGLGWLDASAPASSVKARRQRSEEEIRVALEAVSRLKRHARDMRKSGATEKTVAEWINEGRP
jgi:hypothetical protein